MFRFYAPLNLSWRRPLSYRNQSIDLLRKSIDWFLYDNGLRHERVRVVRGKGKPTHSLLSTLWYQTLRKIMLCRKKVDTPLRGYHPHFVIHFVMFRQDTEWCLPQTTLPLNKKPYGTPRHSPPHSGMCMGFLVVLGVLGTAQNMKISIKDFFSKCEQIRKETAD